MTDFVIVRARRDTAAAWQAANPVLGDGEMGYETDTRKLKFGTGITAWNTLPYVQGYDNPVFTTLECTGTAKLPLMEGELIGAVSEYVVNNGSETLPKGTPVYVTGTVGNSSVFTVDKAQSNNSAKMPAIGILSQALAPNASGRAVGFGHLHDVDTAALAARSTLYVAATGGLTATIPTTGFVQAIGSVARSNQNNGIIVAHLGSSRAA